ncbi:MAG: hypothetical protein ACREQA_10320 [Candidatus Binatia bacterium]
MTSLGTARNAYRALSQFHENEKLVTWLRSQPAVVWLTPKRRRIGLALCALLVGLVSLLSRQTKWRDQLIGAPWLSAWIAFPLLLGFLYLLYLAAAHFRALPSAVRQRPQILLHLLFWVALAAIWLTPNNGAFWKSVLILIVVSLPYLLWRSGYMVMSGQRGKAAATSFHDHLFYLWPVWDGTNTPAGKGLDYLSQHEAQSADAFARAQLAGLKLLMLILLWEGVMFLMGGIIYGDPGNRLTRWLGGYNLGIPRLKNLISGDASASPLTAWASLYFELIWETLKLAAKGHFWVGILRLCGFNVFRNTYKPLLSESIVDFWNRYYYYFKELLVEFFFFPAYLRYFRTWPRLRMFTAVFAAAFVGNIYYHLLQLRNPLVAAEFAAIWQILSPRLMYCFLLALGIYVSMLRQQKRRGKSEETDTVAAKARRLRSIAGVWTFFALIHIWNVGSGLLLLERVKFFFSLFGIS